MPTHNQEHVNVLQTQALQTLLQRQFQAGIVRCPRLGHDHDVLTLDARRKGLLQALAHLILVTIAVSAIDQTIAGLESMNDGFLDFARLSFPGAYDNVSGVFTVELQDGRRGGGVPNPTAGMSWPLLSLKVLSVISAGV